MKGPYFFTTYHKSSSIMYPKDLSSGGRGGTCHWWDADLDACFRSTVSAEDSGQGFKSGPPRHSSPPEFKWCKRSCYLFAGGGVPPNPTRNSEGGGGVDCWGQCLPQTLQAMWGGS